MSLYVVKNTSSSTSVKSTGSLIVAAESPADAREFAGSHFNGDSSWADAEVVALAEETLDASGSMAGFTWRISVTGGTGQTVDPIVVEVTGDSDDDLDDVMNKLVTAIDATEMTGSNYASPPVLQVAEAAYNNGDALMIVEVFSGSGDTLVNLQNIYTLAIIDEGIAAATLTLVVVNDTETKAEVLVDTFK